jgi:hypothetical protein
VPASCRLSGPVKYREFLDCMVNHWLLKDSTTKVKGKVYPRTDHEGPERE